MNVNTDKKKGESNENISLYLAIKQLLFETIVKELGSANTTIKMLNVRKIRFNEVLNQVKVHHLMYTSSALITLQVQNELCPHLSKLKKQLGSILHLT